MNVQPHIFSPTKVNTIFFSHEEAFKNKSIQSKNILYTGKVFSNCIERLMAANKTSLGRSFGQLHRLT